LAKLNTGIPIPSGQSKVADGKPCDFNWREVRNGPNCGPLLVVE